MANCYFNEKEIALNAKKKGLDYVTTGGRNNKPIFYNPECEDVIFTAAKGEAIQCGNNILVIDYGFVKLVEGEIIEKEEASVHGCWKVRKHQHAYKIKKTKNKLPYIFFNYSIGSYDCLSCLLVEDKKILYRELSKRIGHKGLIIYPENSIIIPNGIILSDKKIKVNKQNIYLTKQLFLLGYPVLLIVNNFYGFIPEIKTNINSLNNVA